MDEITSRRASRGLLELDSGGSPLEKVAEEISQLAPDTIVASIMKSTLAAKIAIDDFDAGVISALEAEGIVHAQADLHPVVNSFYTASAVLAKEQGRDLDAIGYFALAKKSVDLIGAKLARYATLDDKGGILEDLNETFSKRKGLLNVRPYLDKCRDHVINHFLVHDIAASEEYIDAEELDMLLSRAEAITPILTGMTADLIEHVPMVDPPPGLIDLIRIIGHIKPAEAISSLLQALKYCTGDTLQEAVIAVVKLGSESPNEVSLGLRRIVGDPDSGEARLPAIDALRFLLDRPVDAGFLIEALESLDPNADYFSDLFTFLYLALRKSGQPRAAGAASSALEKYRRMFGEKVIGHMKSDLDRFDEAGEYGLDDMLDEDIHEICCGTADPSLYDRRTTMTLLREALELEEIWRGTKPCSRGAEAGMAEEAEDIHGWLKTGRNEPCPCGNGKKFKKCCLARAEKARNRADN